jgi:DnaJ-class molecular chaperone
MDAPKPEWIQKLEAEPCECVSCAECHGSGTIFVDLRGHYVGAGMRDDMDEPESCDGCRGSGIIEECDRCMTLDDYDRGVE